MNGRLPSTNSSNIPNQCYPNQDYDYHIQSDLIKDHQENLLEEKPRLC